MLVACPEICLMFLGSRLRIGTIHHNAKVHENGWLMEAVAKRTAHTEWFTAK
jgi:hypothetical protein